jgi:hypothetical protein
MNILCPNCKKATIQVRETEQMEFYFNPKAPKNKCHCTNCLASFQNYDDGSEKRAEKVKTEREERELLAKLKAKDDS